MHDEFEMSMIDELNFFLGLQIKLMEDGIFFNQSKYIKEMLKKLGLEDANPIKTPMSTETKLTRDDEGESIIRRNHLNLRDERYISYNPTMDHLSNPSSNDEIIDDYRCGLHRHHDHDRSQWESKNVCGEVGEVEKISSTGSRFMVRGDECLEGCVGADRDNFGMSKSLVGEILGVVIGESGGEIFRDDAGAIW
ncbi:hypothetical protein Tco_0381487 [Tanacetum coccineum]